MFVLRFSISVQVTKKMIGMIKDEGGGGGGPNKHWGGRGLKKKIKKWWGRLFGTQDQ